LQNPGVHEFLRKDGPWIARAGIPVMVSIACKTVQEFAEVAVEVSRIPGVVAIEANISCPNVEKRGLVFACDPQSSTDVIGTLTRMTNLPVYAKLTADVTDIVEVAEACVRAGARGLTLINTLLGMAIDTERRRPRLAATTGGLSGPAIRPVAVRCVYQVARALPEVPIIGVGGVADTKSAVELMLAGAWAVQVGTANFANPQVMVEIAEGLAGYLERHGFASPADLRGQLAGVPPVEPAFQGSG
jgi:dihydroorotate dehydrogenase (NAD+) catalytic subunit